MYIQVRLHKQDGDRNAAVSAGQSSRCTLMLKRPHIRLDIQRCKELRCNVDDLKGTVRCPLTFARWGISKWKSCGLRRKMGTAGRKSGNQIRTHRRHVAESRICLATQLLNPCLRKIGERRLVTVNETCSDFI
ncbi:hypothetical protein T03_14801 [Trichinella britovi]|uniref:Uncharacterized protein n=1 Tax=Trichinella britovi TaxID=45882 RepID=A0A0V1ANG3_TRIBR|nr:hypothetical protein T03_14801 [Trichinella britovi]